MKNGIKTCSIVFFITLMMTLSASYASSEKVTLVGEVNDNYQFYADGQLYEVAQTPAGDEMVTKYIGEKVEVLCTIADGEELKVITVSSFRTVPE